MKSTPFRFVILLHETTPQMQRPTHWDLMFQIGSTLPEKAEPTASRPVDSLATWALPHSPSEKDEMECDELPLHRLAYLDYEGAVSQNRGFVTRWDAGNFQWTHREPDRVCVDVQGQKLSGTIELTRQSGPRWYYCYQPHHRG